MARPRKTDGVAPAGLLTRWLCALRRLRAVPAARSPGPAAAAPARPKGPLIWFDVPAAGSARAVAELVLRLRQERGGFAVLVTARPDMTLRPDDFPRDAVLQRSPPEAPAALRAFLDHWQPTVVVLAENALLPTLIGAVHQRQIPLFLIDGHAFGKTRPRFRRSFGRTRARLHMVERLLIRDEAGAQYFRRLGAPPWRLEVVGRMEQGSGALPCTEAERVALARVLQARPVWLAAAVPEAEEANVLAALRAALRLSHRLLLILVPDNPARGPALAEHLAGELGWNVALRSRDEDPDDEDEIYIADTEDEYGLWYRLAPVTYLGGTLGGGLSRAPFEPAALGSAIVAGPVRGNWHEDHARLAAAGAARLVRNAVELGEAVSDLLAPDKAAILAHNAWVVSSGGAEVTDRVMRTLLDALRRQDEARAFDPARALAVGRALDAETAAAGIAPPAAEIAEPGAGAAALRLVAKTGGGA